MKTKPKKNKYLDCVYLTEIEHQKLVVLYGQKAVDRLIKDLDYGIDCKGYKYKNHYKVLLVWAGRDNIPIIKPKPTKPEPPKENVKLATPEEIAALRKNMGGVFGKVPFKPDRGKPFQEKKQREIKKLINP